MTDFRAQVVEAMAQAIVRTFNDVDDVAMAEAALDAALDVLGELPKDERPITSRQLIAALRAGKGSDAVAQDLTG